VLRNCESRKVYVCNLFTEPGSTHGYTVSRHIKTLKDYGVNIDTVLVHTDGLSSNVIGAYEREGKHPVVYNKDDVSRLAENVIEGSFVVKNEVPLRHSDRTGEVLWELLNK